MSQSTKFVLLAIGLIVFMATMIGFGMFAMEALQGEPFQMVLKSDGGHSLVQFIQPDRSLISREFPVDLVLDSPQEFELCSNEISLPGCTIEFSDTTMLPGRFQIRIGHALFDVMQRGIIVAGKEYDWHQR